MIKLVRAITIFKRLQKRARNQVIAVNSDGTLSSEADYSAFLPYYNLFSSRLLRKLLSDRRKNEAFSSTVYGAILFADISGFTRLSARLSVEELKFHINEYFSMLLGVVDTYNGDVIKFCGDAVMIMWPVAEDCSNDIKVAVVELASLCALQLLTDCGVYDRGDGDTEVSLRLHCGIASGPIHCMCLGEDERWEFLISGDVLKHVGAAESEAKTGEVCLSPESYHFVDHLFEANEITSGAFKLTGHLQPDVGVDTNAVNESITPGGFLSKTASIRDMFTKGTSLVGNSYFRDEEGGVSSSFDGFKHFPGMLMKGISGRGNRLLTTPPSHDAGDATASISHQATRESGEGKSIISFLAPPRPTTAPTQQPEHEQMVNSSPEIVSGFFRKTPSIRGMFGSPSPATNSLSPPIDQKRSLPAKLRPLEHSSSAVRHVDMHILRLRLNVANDEAIKQVYEYLPKHQPKVSLTDLVDNSNSLLSMATKETNLPGAPTGIPRSNSKYSFSTKDGLLPGSHSPHLKRAFSTIPENEKETQEEMKKVAQMKKDLMQVANRMRSTVLEAAREALENGTLKYLAELRQVVTMFIEILGLDAEFAKGKYRRPQRAISIILACLQRYGGSLRQYVVDDKGCVVILAFGLPGSTHEDNSSRAIETGVAIRRLLYSNRIQCRIGISQGRVYCGIVGSSERCEYAMMGSSVNLAARLMAQAAVNDIVVSGEVYKHAIDDFEFTELPKIKAKGYNKPVAAYSPKERAAKSKGLLLNNAGLSVGKFVGREAELQMMQTAVDDYIEHSRRDPLAPATVSTSVSDSKHIFMIEGSAGVGKSWFISQVQRMLLHTKEVKKVYIACATASHVTSRYFVLRQLLDQIFNMEGSESHALIRHASGLSLKYSSSVDHSMDASPTRLPYSMEECTRVCSSTHAEDQFVMENYLTAVVTWVEFHCADRLLTVHTHTTGPNTQRVERDRGSSITDPTESSMFARKDTLEEITGGGGGLGDRSARRGEEKVPLINLVPLLSEVLPMQYEPNEIVDNMDPIMRWKLCDEIILVILQIALSNYKTALIVENLQWCDIQSLDVIHKLFSTIKQGFVLGSLRRDGGPEGRRPSDGGHPFIDLGVSPSTLIGLEGFGSQQYQMRKLKHISKLCKSVNLHPLSKKEVQMMMENAVGERLLTSHPDLLADSSLQEILTRTGGSPYLTSALVLALRDALLTGRFKGINNLPSGEHNIILNRFDQLTSTDQMILKAASVIGETFTANFLGEVLTAMNATHCVAGLASTLSQLTDSNLIQSYDQPGSTEEDTAFAFTDPSVRLCIYNLMLNTQKEATHTIVGLLLEKRRVEDFKSSFYSIASHFLQSDDLPKKLLYLERSSRICQATHQFQQMATHLENLIQFTTGKSSHYILLQALPPDRRKMDAMNVSNSLVRAPGEHSRTLPTPEAALDKWFKASEIIPSLQVVEMSPECVNSIRHSAEEANAGPAGAGAKILTKRHRDIDAETVFCWFGKMANSQIMLGNYKMSYNLAVYALTGLRYPVSIIEKGLKYQSFKYKLAMWGHKVLPLPMLKYDDSIADVFSFYVDLAQILLLRGFANSAHFNLKTAARLIPFLPSTTPDVVIYYSIHSIAYSALGHLENAHSMRDLASLHSRHFADEPMSNGIRFACQGILHACQGDFDGAISTMNNAITYFSRNDTFAMKMRCSIFNGWMTLFVGRTGSTKRTLDKLLAFSAAVKNSLGSKKWAMELQVVLNFMEGKSHDALELLSDMKQVRKRDHPNATACALEAFIHLFKDNTVVELSEALVANTKYSCQRLSGKDIVTPITGFFLFCAGYSALRIIEVVKVSASPSNTESRGSLFLSTRSKQTLASMKECANLVIESMKRACACIPCLRACLLTLDIMYHRLHHPSRYSESEAELTALSHSKEFTLALAFFYKQRSLYYQLLGANSSGSKSIYLTKHDESVKLTMDYFAKYESRNSVKRGESLGPQDSFMEVVHADTNLSPSEKFRAGQLSNISEADSIDYTSTTSSKIDYIRSYRASNSTGSTLTEVPEGCVVPLSLPLPLLSPTAEAKFHLELDCSVKEEKS